MRLQPKEGKKTHNEACLLDIAGKLGVLGQETVTFRRISITNCCREGQIIVGCQKCVAPPELAAGRDGTNQGGSFEHHAPKRF